MKFHGNKNSVFANALVSEYVTSNDFNIEVSTGKWLDKEIERAMPDKNDFLEEIEKASKKTRNGRSFTKLERAQMKKDAAMKRAKALGVEGSPEEGAAFYPTLAKARRKARNAKEKGRQYYNTLAKVNHHATGRDYGRLYNAECRESKRRDAEKRLMRQTEYEPDYDYFDARKALAAERLYDAGFTKVQLEEEITNKVKEQAKAEEMLHRLQDYMRMLELHCHNLEEESDILQMRLDDATETYNAARYDYDAISLWG